MLRVGTIPGCLRFRVFEEGDLLLDQSENSQIPLDWREEMALPMWPYWNIRYVKI